MSGQSPIELTITIEGEDKTYKEKHLVYETITLKDSDTLLNDYIQKAVSGAKFQAEDVKVRATMQI